MVYNTGVWENGTPISSSYALTASFITPTGTNAFVQGGNSFGTIALLGTNDTQNLQFETSGSVRMTISSSGNIGIGTATPSTTLQVAGTSSLQNIIFNTDNTYDIGTSAVRARNIWSNGNLVGTTGFFNSAVMYNSARIGGEHTATALLHISSSNSAQMMRINSPSNANILFVSGSGNIGIGTATPSVRLHLSQSSGTFQRVDINNANADGVNATTEYYTNTGATPDLFGATSFRLQGGTTDAFKQFQVYIANLTSPRFIINGSGNVGIGTTSPSIKNLQASIILG